MFAWSYLGECYDRCITIALVTLTIGWCVMRLVGLELSPVGMSPDEGLAGLHVQCYAETGKSADGSSWPHFAEGLGGGLYTPFYLAILFGWTRIFGISLGSLRAMSGLFSVLAIVGLWFLARRLTNTRTALLVVLAAALSPWSFQLSRLSTDAPAMPAFLVWGTYLFLRSTRATSASLGGIVLGIAAYTYPPARVHVPLLVLLLLVLERKRLSPVRLLAFLGAMVVLCLPLIDLLLSGTLMHRAKGLSIFTGSYVQQHRADLSAPAFMVKQLLENLHEHLRPSYLFFTGDPNLRHSMQRIGELGWLDVLAVAVAASALGVVVFRSIFARSDACSPSSPLWRLMAVSALAGAFGTLPAAMCWEGLPHAYRAIGTYPCLALFTGACLSAIWKRSRIVPAVVLGLAAAQTLYFFPYYFGAYRIRSYDMFDGSLRDAAEQRNFPKFERVAKTFPELGIRYHLVHYFGHSCASSLQEAQRINALP
jgi:4-amino-4-deoxy-L-arabinose transferase-like glycosyltransferase